MYGNQTLPGISVSEGYRVTTGSIWQGYPEATCFRTVKVNGDSADAAAIPYGTIMKELIADGSYEPITESDIVSTIAALPGVRLAIVADKTAKKGTVTTEAVDGGGSEEVSTPATVLVGVSGVVNKDLLYVGDKKFGELTNDQKIGLRLQLEAWNFELTTVTQA